MRGEFISYKIFTSGKYIWNHFLDEPEMDEKFNFLDSIRK